jgi:hypothetical protein
MFAVELQQAKNERAHAGRTGAALARQFISRSKIAKGTPYEAIGFGHVCIGDCHRQ